MHNPSSPPSTMLKDQKNLPRRIQDCTWGGGRGWGRAGLVARGY